MADENTTTTDTAEVQQGDPAAEQSQQQQTDPGADLNDGGKKALAAERKAARDAQKRVRDLEARIQQYEDATKSETDKLTDRATKAEQSYADLLAKHHGLIRDQAIAQAATDAQSTDPETVTLYLRDAVEVDEDGNVTGIEQALDALQQRKPHLFRTAPAGSRDAAASTPAGFALNDGDALTRALLGAVGKRR